MTPNDNASPETAIVVPHFQFVANHGASNETRPNIMLTIVIYDITKNQTRKRIADSLLDLGLIRTQYSVFFGMLDNNRIDELALYAEKELADTDKLYIIPVHRDDLNAARIIGPDFDDQLITDELLTKVV